MTKVHLTDEQVSNLGKLATHLESLPREYGHFTMIMYAAGQSFSGKDPHNIYPREVYRAREKPWHELSCDTAACCLGHGPLAGVRPDHYASWVEYEYCFLPDVGLIQTSEGREVASRASDFLFGADFGNYTNDHLAAAARIRYVLEHRRAPASFAHAWPGPDYDAVMREIGYGDPIPDLFYRGESEE